MTHRLGCNAAKARDKEIPQRVMASNERFSVPVQDQFRLLLESRRISSRFWKGKLSHPGGGRKSQLASTRTASPTGCRSRLTGFELANKAY